MKMARWHEARRIGVRALNVGLAALLVFTMTPLTTMAYATDDDAAVEEFPALEQTSADDAGAVGELGNSVMGGGLTYDASSADGGEAAGSLGAGPAPALGAEGGATSARLEAWQSRPARRWIGPSVPSR